MARVVRVLIVDDDPVDLELTRRLLSGTVRARFETTTATRLPDAIQHLRNEAYEVLLLDLNLPSSRGLATLDAVRQISKDMPVIVLTGLSDENTALCSLDHGAQDYLVKGNVTSEMLVKAIQYAIQRQHLLQQINHAKELLERKNRRLSELYETAHRFVDNVSHEFRTPLTVIKEYTSLVRDGLVETVEEQHRFLDVVADRADDLNTMVDDMLDVSRLEAGMLCVTRTYCSLSGIMDRLRPALERKAAVKHVTLEFELPPDLPEVYCDEEKVCRVLINLTVNAIKFCQEKGAVRIWARPCEDDPGVTVGVTDNGPGIDEEGLAGIFERFKQVNGNIRGSHRGFGLGLNIAKELVDLNFGKMSVQSEVGVGSTFTFTLPPADPLEVMRRYLDFIMALRNGSSAVSLVTASSSVSGQPRVRADVEAYLHGVLRRNDLLFRGAEGLWAIVLPVGGWELDGFFKRARSVLHDINRNRIHGPLPAIELVPAGNWRAGKSRQELMRNLREVLQLEETVPCPGAC